MKKSVMFATVAMMTALTAGAASLNWVVCYLDNPLAADGGPMLGALVQGEWGLPNPTLSLDSTSLRVVLEGGWVAAAVLSLTTGPSSNFSGSSPAGGIPGVDQAGDHPPETHGSQPMATMGLNSDIGWGAGTVNVRNDGLWAGVGGDAVQALDSMSYWMVTFNHSQMNDIVSAAYYDATEDDWYIEYAIGQAVNGSGAADGSGDAYAVFHGEPEWDQLYFGLRGQTDGTLGSLQSALGVPEPTAMALLALGAAAFGLRRRFRK